MPIHEIATRTGFSAVTLGRKARNLGKKKGNRVPAIARETGVTDAQAKDVNTLRQAGYTLEEAVAIVTKPKVKIRFATKVKA